MPTYTIEGRDRESGMTTRVMLKAPTRAEALLQARERGVVPESMLSDDPGDQDVTYAELVRVVQELQSLQLETRAAKAELVTAVRTAAGTFVLRMLVWFGLTVVAVWLGASMAIHGTKIIPEREKSGQVYFGP